MKEFPFIWLLFNTRWGKIILGIAIGYAIISILGWWLIPIIAVLIGIALLYNYYEQKALHTKLEQEKEKKKNRWNAKQETTPNRGKKELVVGICMLVFAVLFSLFLIFHVYWAILKYREPFYEETPNEVEEVVLPDTSTYVPDTLGVFENEKPKAKSGKSKSAKSVSSSSHHSSSYDNMRGFDPASEDDSDDNGISRYMENNDEEGWD